MEVGASSSRAFSCNRPSLSRANPRQDHFLTIADPVKQQQFPSNVMLRVSAPSRQIFRLTTAALKAHTDEGKEMPGQKPDILKLSNLTALSPLDGRYWSKVKDLAPYMSEYGLIYFRVFVEVKWLVKLSEIPQVVEVPSFSREAQSFLQSLLDGFDLDDAMEIKNIERVTNHDVKAVEYFLKQKCESNPEIAEVLEFFHFASTSEDINNLAHALMLRESMNEVILSCMDKVINAISNVAVDNAHIAMLSRTHGQPASPTTLGKDMTVFAVRLNRERREISKVEVMGKFAGAL